MSMNPPHIIPPIGDPIQPVQMKQPIPGMFQQENVNMVQIRNLLLELLAVCKDIQANLQADMVCNSHDHSAQESEVKFVYPETGVQDASI